MQAWYGGSFDPPHNGHFEGAIHAAKEIDAARVTFLPCARSPLKSQTGASNTQRIHMLELGCTEYNSQQTDIALSTDPLELALPSPSYTVNTLKVLREQLGRKVPLCFFLGEDSLYTLPKWKAWQSLTDYCHLVVLRRVGINHNDCHQFSAWLAARKTELPEALSQQANGLIYFCQTPLVTISSSEIREMLKQQSNSLNRWLPQSVLAYAQAQNIYNRQ